MSRTRGGRKRSAAPSSGLILFQSFSSAGVRRTSWPGSRTQAPSSATSCGARKPLQHRGKCRRRKARLELQAQPLEPDAGQVRVVRMEDFERSRRARASGAARRRAKAPSVVPAMRIDGAAARPSHRSRSARARGRARTPRGRRSHGARSSSAASAALRVVDRMRVELRQPLGRAALARGRAQVEEAAARDRALRRGVAQHEAVVHGRRDRAAPARAGHAPRSPGAIGRRRAARRAPRRRWPHGAAAPASIASPASARRRARASSRRCGRSARAAPDRARRRRARSRPWRCRRPRD